MLISQQNNHFSYLQLKYRLYSSDKQSMKYKAFIMRSQTNFIPGIRKFYQGRTRKRLTFVVRKLLNSLTP